MKDHLCSLAGHAAWLLLGACAAQEPGTTTLDAGDPAAFGQHVQPYVQTACATLDCHGDRGRALRLYSELGLRDDDALRSEPVAEASDPVALTFAELDANVRALAAVGLQARSPSEHLALRKPLASKHGGIHHVGGVHWHSRQDPGYLCLRQFLLADGPADAADSCAQALDALAR
jgi:hypothetical protein